jgi:hypothetical protein
MDALNAALRSIGVQSPMLEIDLRPSELIELLRSQAMPIGYQDRRRVPWAIASSAPRRLDQPLDLTFG